MPGGSHISALALVADKIPHVLVTARESLSLLSAGAPTVRTVVVRDAADQLASALLVDDDALRALVDATRSASRVGFRFQVWTEAVETVARTLLSAGVQLDLQDVPRVSGATVALWNTKRGGREILESIDSLKPFLPCAEFCFNASEISQLLEARRQGGLSWIIKPDASLGGNGIVVVDERQPDSVALSIRIREASRRSTKGRVADVTHSGWMVEELIGDIATNVSPTADYRVHAAGAEFVGIGLQILRDGVGYVGVRSLPSAAPYRDRCVALGDDVCKELERRGYRGPVNVDFVVTASGRVAVVEVNVRQSAPLETFAALRRRFGPNWESIGYVSEMARVVTSPPSAWGEVRLRAQHHTWTDYVAVAPEDGDASSPGPIRILVSTAVPSRLRALVGAAAQATSIQPEAASLPTVVLDDTEATPGGADATQTVLARRMRRVARRFRALHPLSEPAASYR